MLRYALGRFLELAGIGVVTLGFLVGLSYDAIRIELTYLAVGSGVFLVGRFLERSRRA